jgi:DNA replication protein DnaC
MPKEWRGSRDLENFDITDLSVEEVQFQENEIRREKSKRFSVLMRKPEDFELTEADKEDAIIRAINARKTSAYFKKIHSMPEAKNLSAKKYFDIFCKNWGIYPQNEKIVKLLCYYFAEDKKFEELGFSLKKGLLLTGGVGCGKTTLMKFFSTNRRQKYAVKSVRDISYQFAEEGFEMIRQYNQRVWCFDDLGTEGERKHYGDIVNVMKDILLNRYDRNMTTHLTTNLTGDQIRECYGERVASRLREMCNVIEFPTTSKDLRQ